MTLRLRIVLLFAACLAIPSLRAATFTWNGSVSTDWFNTNNWTPTGLPGTNDTVNFSSGTINFTAPVAFLGQFNWSGGTLTGNALTIASNGVMTISSSSTKFLWTALTNAGTVTWSGGNLEVDYSSANNEFGFIQNLASALWDIQSNQQLYNNFPNSAYFQNAGTVRKSAGSGPTMIALPFFNSGTVSNLVGTLTFSASGTIEGAFAASSGTTMNFSSGAFGYSIPPTMAGPGTIQITGGTLMLISNTIPNLQLAGGTITLGQNFQGGTITNLTLSAGTLNGNNTVGGTFTSAAALPGSLTLLSGATVNWNGGSIAGPVNIAAGANLNIGGSPQKYLWGPLTNAGTVTWSGSGNFEVDYSSVNNQFGFIQNLAGALWDIQSSQTLYNGSPNGAYFQNAGTVRKSADGNATTISIPFNNSGLVTNLQGTLRFQGGGTIEGTFGAAPGTTINFNAGSFSYNAPPTLTGAGTIQITGGTLTLANPGIPNLQLAGATITLAPGFQGGAITNLALTGGTLNGNLIVGGTFSSAANLPGSVTVLSGATMNWSGGTIYGPVNVAAGATLNLTGGPTKILWNALTNAGTVTWSGGGNLEVDYSTANGQFGLIRI